MPHKRDHSQPFDDSVWLDLFVPLKYAGDTDVADRVARLLNSLSLELENGGSMGVLNAGLSIDKALRLIFPFTAIGRGCMILFLVSLDKGFPTQPDILATLSEAMKQTKAALERGPVRVKQRRKESRRK